MFGGLLHGYAQQESILEHSTMFYRACQGRLQGLVVFGRQIRHSPRYVGP